MYQLQKTIIDNIILGTRRVSITLLSDHAGGCHDLYSQS